MKTLSATRTASPFVWLLMLVLLVCGLGNNQPPPPASVGEPPPPGALSISCPAYDPSVFPADLGVSTTSATFPTTPGSFAVSRSGEATYSVPLAVLPGRAGVEPSLAITYGSSAGEGLLGVGFGLQGLSVINSYRFFRLGDVNGDGVADLIQCVNPQYDGDDPTTRRWTVHLWSPSLPGGPGFDPTPRSIPFVDKVLDCGWGKRSIYVADVDGDGIASLVVPFTGGTFGAVRHVAGDEWTSGPLHLFRDPSRQFTMLHFLDTNGDGLTDVVMTGLGQGGCYDPDGC